MNPFVQLKINNQALETAFTPVSPGEVFKVFGSERFKHKQHNKMSTFFSSVYVIMATLMIMQTQNRITYPDTLHIQLSCI